jgi:hypothetical protein
MAQQPKPVFDSIPLDVTRLSQEELMKYANDLAEELQALQAAGETNSSLRGCFNKVGLAYHRDKGNVLIGEVMFRFCHLTAAQVLANHCQAECVQRTRSTVSFLINTSTTTAAVELCDWCACEMQLDACDTKHTTSYDRDRTYCSERCMAEDASFMWTPEDEDVAFVAQVTFFKGRDDWILDVQETQAEEHKSWLGGEPDYAWGRTQVPETTSPSDKEGLQTALDRTVRGAWYHDRCMPASAEHKSRLRTILSRWWQDHIAQMLS